MNYSKLVEIGNKAEVIVWNKFVKENKENIFNEFVDSIYTMEQVDEDNIPLVAINLEPRGKKTPKEIEELHGLVLIDDDGSRLARLWLLHPLKPMRPPLRERIRKIFKRDPISNLRRFAERKEREGLATKDGFEEGTRQRMTFSNAMMHLFAALLLLLIAKRANLGQFRMAAAFLLPINVWIISFFINEENARRTPWVHELAVWGTFIGALMTIYTWLTINFS